jgi:hypothetical protein
VGAEMRRPLRTAIKALREAGLKVSHVEQRSRHTFIFLNSGERLSLSKGVRVNPNHEQKFRSMARKIARATERNEREGVSNGRT